jgi:hypothetical protein
MKKLFTLLAFIVITILNAQAPQGFNYQATVRNSSGALIVNQNVNFKFNIMLNSQTSLPVYSETHFAPTDELGQVNLIVGTGTATTGTFSAINWANGTYYLGIELNTGTSYVAMGTTQLLSVPYALHANTANSTTSNSGGLTHYVGELFGGGIVVSVWKTNGVEHGLIASLNDLSAGIQWTIPAFQDIEIGPSAQSTRDGLANTNAIVAQAGAGTSYAAGLCKAYNAGGFNDWYLPALNELKQCDNSFQIVNEVLGDTNGFQVSNTVFFIYWSSTESASGNAWGKVLGGGFTDCFLCNEGKFGNRLVRAVRRF